MNKAFIFDMDGVLVDSERAWHIYAPNFQTELYGEKIRAQMGELIGMSLANEYKLAKKHGFALTKEETYQKYDEQATIIYQKARMTQNLALLIADLIKKNYKLAIVSSSRKSWIDSVTPRIPQIDSFSLILSLNDHPDLKAKPNPDGYIWAMRELRVKPESTFILEDSNTGIKAAKASGAHTIGFSGNLVAGYSQTNADIYASTIEEVLGIIKNHD